MNVAVCVLAYDRPHLLKRCLASIATGDYPHTLFVLDNGSTDAETCSIVQSLEGGWRNDGEDTTIGHGKNLLLERAYATGADIIVVSDDDYEYKPGWLKRMVAFAENAPDLGLLCGYLEPDYVWARPAGVFWAGGEKALIRDSVPGGCWLFPRERYHDIYPLREQTGGEDMAVCRKLWSKGYILAAMDEADHIGETESLIGQDAWKFADPLDRERWNI